MDSVIRSTHCAVFLAPVAQSPHQKTLLSLKISHFRNHQLFIFCFKGKVLTKNKRF